DSLPGVVPDLPLPRRLGAVPRHRLVPAVLFRPADQPHDPGRDGRPPRPGHGHTGAAKTLRPSRADRAPDPADLDLRVGHRCGDLPDALRGGWLFVDAVNDSPRTLRGRIPDLNYAPDPVLESPGLAGAGRERGALENVARRHHERNRALRES